MSHLHSTPWTRRLFLSRTIQWMAGVGLWHWAGEGGAVGNVQRELAGAQGLQAVLRDALQGQSWMPSPHITLDVPELAENGAMVPVTVESHLPDTLELLVFAEPNPVPLSARFHFMPEAVPWVSLRLRLNESGGVLVIAKTPKGYFGTRRQVKVMLGGCG